MPDVQRRDDDHGAPDVVLRRCHGRHHRPVVHVVHHGRLRCLVKVLIRPCHDRSALRFGLVLGRESHGMAFRLEDVCAFRTTHLPGHIRGVFGLHEFGRSDEIHNAEAGECLHLTCQPLIEIV